MDCTRETSLRWIAGYFAVLRQPQSQNSKTFGLSQLRFSVKKNQSKSIAIPHFVVIGSSRCILAICSWNFWSICDVQTIPVATVQDCLFHRDKSLPALTALGQHNINVQPYFIPEHHKCAIMAIILLSATCWEDYRWLLGGWKHLLWILIQACGPLLKDCLSIIAQCLLFP